MPNRANIQKWVDALRSGKYIQGRNQLAYVTSETGENRYCCLGVACELAIENGVKLSRTKLFGDSAYGLYAYGPFEETLRLPEAVVIWLGTQNADQSLLDQDPKCGGRQLSVVNDAGFDFDYIANLIEREYLQP